MASFAGVFRAVTTGVKVFNIASGLASIVVPPILQGKLNSLQHDLDDLNNTLTGLGVSLADGAEFFSQVKNVTDASNWRATQLDTILNSQIAPKIEAIYRDAAAMGNIPIPATVGSASSDPDSDIFDKICISFAVIGLVLEAGSLVFSIKGLRDFYKARDTAKYAIPDSDIKLTGFKRVLDGKVESVQDISADIKSINNKEPSLLRNMKLTKFQKVGLVVDVVMGALGLAGLIYSSVKMAQQEDELEKAIAKAQTDIATYKAELATVAGDKTDVIQSFPEFFVYCREKFQVISQIATLSSISGGVGAADPASIAALLDQSRKAFTIPDSDLDFLATQVAQIKAIEADTSKSDAEQAAATQPIFAIISAKISNQKMIEVLGTVVSMFDGMSKALQQAYANFTAISDIISAVDTLKTLVASKASFDTMKSIAASLMRVNAQNLSDDTVKALLAMYVLPPGGPRTNDYGIDVDGIHTKYQNYSTDLQAIGNLKAWMNKVQQDNAAGVSS